MNVLLIIYDSSLEADVLVNRIKSLGDNYVFWNNHWLVKTELTADQVYNRIVTNGYEGKSIFITRIDNTIGVGYWGIMNKTLWDWLKA